MSLDSLFSGNRFNFTGGDLLKIGKSAVLVGVGAAAAYGLNSMSLLDWGPATPLVVAGLTWAANTVRVWVSDSK